MSSSVYSRFFSLFFLIVGIFAFQAARAEAAYNLIMFSSVTTNTGYYSDCRAVVSDASGNIFAAGQTNSDIFTIKYDNNFNFISSRTYDRGFGDDRVNSLAVDNSGNVYAAGYTANGGDQDIYIAKYNNQLSQVLATLEYDSFGNYDQAYGIALDKDGNVFIAAQSNGNFLTIKCDSNLVVISSVTYDNGADDSPYRLAVDNDGNVFVTGSRRVAGNANMFTIKYDNGLNYLASAEYVMATFDGGGGIAVDASGSVFVAGLQGEDIITVKYNNNLVVISSTVKTSPTEIDSTDPPRY